MYMTDGQILCYLDAVHCLKTIKWGKPTKDHRGWAKVTSVLFYINKKLGQQTQRIMHMRVKSLSQNAFRHCWNPPICFIYMRIN